MRTVSVRSMLAQIEGLRGTDDLTQWEDQFVGAVCEKARTDTTVLSSKQVTIVERIYREHFA